jgi:hypothetical protein
VTTVIFVIASLQSAYLSGESVELRVRLRNTGSETVRLPSPSEANWQPVYFIEGPGLKVQADHRRMLRSASEAAPPAAEARLIEIPPGKEWVGAIDLSYFFAGLAPGDYKIHGLLEWEGIRVESNIAAFRVVTPGFGALSFGVWGDPPGNALRVVALQRSNGRSVLYEKTMRVKGTRELVEDSTPLLRVTDADPAAADPLTPSTDHNLESDLFGWVFWREGRTLVGRPNLISIPVRLELPGDVRMALPPALMDRSHEADVFAIAGASGAAQRLVVSRFVDPAESPENYQARVVAELPLPAAGAFGAAVAPDEGRHRILALAAFADGALTLYHASYAGKAAPREFKAHPVHSVDEVEAIPDSPPVVWAAPDGSSRVGVFVRVAGKPKRCLLVEMPFDALGNAGKPRITPWSLPSGVASARLVYYHTQRGALEPERSLALWTEDGRVCVPQDDGLRVVRQGWSKDAPRVLMVLKWRPFLLELDRERGFRLGEF